MLRELTLTLSVLTAGGVASGQGGVVIFQGQAGQPGDVLVVDPAGVNPPLTPPALQGVRLLDLEVNGRTHLGRFLPGRAWLRSDVSGAARVVLPERQGSLYHFERPSQGAASAFGFFVVDEAGETRVVIERPGTGALGDVDPFGARPAVAPDGQGALVATTLAAGGDLLQLDLESTSVQVRTASVPPLQFQLRGLAFAQSWGAAVTTTGALRFDRSAPGDAQPVDFGLPAPAAFLGDVVLSGNGLFAATAAGSFAPGQLHVFSFSPSGPAQRASDSEAAISPAGFLPEFEHGPFLAVADDGSTVVWRTEGAKREAFMARTSAPLGHTPAHLSSDGNFADTLDELGQYSFRPGSSTAVLAVGSISDNAPFVTEGADLFEVALDGNGAPQFTNLSLTSGATQTPFPAASDLDPARASWLPDQSAILFHDDNGDGRLLATRPGQVGLQLVLDSVKDLDRIEALGSDLVATVRRSFGNKDKELHLIPAGTLVPGPALFSAPDAHEFPLGVSRVGGKYAFVERLPTHEFLWIFDAATSQTTLLTPRPLRYGESIGLGPSGEFTFTVGASGAPAVFAKWPFPGSPKRLITPVTPGFVLPGA